MNYFNKIKLALALTIFHGSIITQGIPNEKCISECSNSDNTLSYVFCYVDKSFTTWEYCIPEQGSAQSNQQLIVQTEFSNLKIQNSKVHFIEPYKKVM